MIVKQGFVIRALADGKWVYIRRDPRLREHYLWGSDIQQAVSNIKSAMQGLLTEVRGKPHLFDCVDVTTIELAELTINVESLGA